MLCGPTNAINACNATVKWCAKFSANRKFLTFFLFCLEIHRKHAEATKHIWMWGLYRNIFPADGYWLVYFLLSAPSLQRWFGYLADGHSISLHSSDFYSTYPHLWIERKRKRWSGKTCQVFSFGWRCSSCWSCSCCCCCILNGYYEIIHVTEGRWNRHKSGMKWFCQRLNLKRVYTHFTCSPIQMHLIGLYAFISLYYSCG